MDNLAAPIPSTFPQPAVQPEVSSPVESQGRPWSLWLIGGIALLALGAALGIFSAKFFNQSQNQTQLPTALSPVQSPTPTSAPNPTADWKTYTNEQSGYSLKYPETWKFQADSEGCGPVFFYPNTIRVWLTICGLHINQGDTPEEMAGRSANSSSAKLESREQISIDGHSGIRQEVKTGDAQLAIEIYVGNVVGVIKFADGQTRKDTGTLAIYYYIQDLDKLTEAKSSLDQILSTFKFISPSG